MAASPRKHKHVVLREREVAIVGAGPAGYFAAQ